MFFRMGYPRPGNLLTYAYHASMFTKDTSFCAVLLASVMIAVLGCTSHDQRPGKKVNPDLVFLDYRIWGDEERNIVTVTLQFRQGNRDGDAISLVHPANVVLDDEPLKPDSSKMNGVYYEINKAVREFEGDHEIVYTNSQGEQFRESFYFSIMQLKTHIQSPVRRKDLVFNLAGLDSSDFIHVIMTDTSFYGRGIDRVDTVKAGQLVISQADLENIRNGPVFLEFYREENWPLKETTAAGGRMSISYSLKRAFDLVDPSQ